MLSFRILITWLLLQLRLASTADFLIEHNGYVTNAKRRNGGFVRPSFRLTLEKKQHRHMKSSNNYHSKKSKKSSKRSNKQKLKLSLQSQSDGKGKGKGKPKVVI
jgi:hypothetical protein